MPFRLGMLTVVIGAALVAGGCLKKDIVSTWYVEADRRVVWTVEERDVRSDSDTPDERDRDEDDYLSDVRERNHPVARGLRQFTPTGVTSRLLRERPPFNVVTEATFPSLQVLGERILTRFGVRGRSFVEFTRDGFEWTWSIDEGTRVDEDLIDDDLTALFEASTIRIALAEGRFVSSSRGNLSEDRRIATFPVADLLDDHGKKTGEETTFVLRWSSR